MNKAYMLLILPIIFFIPMIFAEENVTTTANCTYELELCVGEYNSLLQDFKNGTNCGTGFQILKAANQNLTMEKEIADEKLNKFKGYKAGFWISTALTVSAIMLLFLRKKKEKDGTKKEV